MFRRRLGATIRFRLRTNPDLVPDDDLSLATRREIHLLPPPDDAGVARAEIILPNATILNNWDLCATLLPAQSAYIGKWYADAYAEFNNGIIVKISRTISFWIDPKYKAP